MEKSKKVEYILMAILVIIIILIILVVNSRRSSSNIFNYQRVTNASTFFIIEECANKYIRNISAGNKDNVLKLLDYKYIQKNNINQENVISKLGNLIGTYSFKTVKMFETQVNKNHMSYYTYGKLRENDRTSLDYGMDYYLIITVNQEDNTFTITPYDGKLFKEDLNGK